MMYSLGLSLRFCTYLEVLRRTLNLLLRENATATSEVLTLVRIMGLVA